VASFANVHLGLVIVISSLRNCKYNSEWKPSRRCTSPGGALHVKLALRQVHSYNLAYIQSAICYLLNSFNKEGFEDHGEYSSLEEDSELSVN
jgi:hypothetical protein